MARPDFYRMEVDNQGESIRTGYYNEDTVQRLIEEAKQQMAQVGRVDQRIAELEAELLEQARVNGMGSEREATLMARVAVLEAQLAECKADAEQWNKTAADLWMLLDDIDTASDMAKYDDKLYLALCETIQRKRFAIMSGEEVDAARSGKGEV